MASLFKAPWQSLARRVSAWRQERDALAEAREFWDAGAPQEGEDHYWGSQPLVRRLINRRVTGDPNRWPMEWFAEHYAATPFERGLSVGCGSGTLERDVISKNICREMEGLDFSSGAITAARREAEEAGLDHRLHYRTADVNRLSLPPDRYDIVFFHGSLHHVRQLERVLDEVRRALIPGGLLYLDEYTGPSREEWTESHWRFANAAFEALPDELKNRPQLMIPLPMDDPLESIRSSEIPRLVRKRFTIIEDRPYGGNILWFIFPCLDMENLRQDTSGAVSRLIALEEHLLEQGWVQGWFRVMVGRKGWAASAED